LSTIYFIRHGQAGSRDDYDRLSPLGREQATLLGLYLRYQGIHFDRAVCGGLRRQQETAQLALAGLHEFGLAPREAETDDNWSEFDLDAVYRAYAPQMAVHDSGFRAEMEQVRQLIDSGDASIHRRWTASDSEVIRAWIEDRHPFDGESWGDFVARVRQGWNALETAGISGNTLVFTSATPVSIIVADAFGSALPPHIMKLAAASLNSNVTVLASRGGEPHLLSFNSVAHLTEARLRTFR
jgi:broad specificity phosphatase PhoE